MVNPRRIARELALKILYQMEAGRKSLTEALDAGIQQVREAVTTPVTQTTTDALSALRESSISHSEVTPPQENRHRRLALEAFSNILLEFAEELKGETGLVVKREPIETLEQVEKNAKIALVHAQKSIEAASSRITSYPEIYTSAGVVAEKRVLQIEQSFKKHITAAVLCAEFVIKLVNGTSEKHAEIDERLASLSTGWSLDRQAVVDRNIMRLAAYEILYMKDIPTGATINEAVELAKKYSTAESGRFVNGILGALSGEQITLD